MIFLSRYAKNQRRGAERPPPGSSRVNDDGVFSLLLCQKLDFSLVKINVFTNNFDNLLTLVYAENLSWFGGFTFFNPIPHRGGGAIIDPHVKFA